MFCSERGYFLIKVWSLSLRWRRISRVTVDVGHILSAFVFGEYGSFVQRFFDCTLCCLRFLQDEVYTYLLYLILDIATAYGIYNIASIWNVRSQLQAQREDKIEEKYFALSVEQRRKCSRADTPHFTVVSTLSPAVRRCLRVCSNC